MILRPWLPAPINEWVIINENNQKKNDRDNKRRNGPIFTVLSEYSWDIFNSELEVYNKKYLE